MRHLSGGGTGVAQQVLGKSGQIGMDLNARRPSGGQGLARLHGGRLARAQQVQPRAQGRARARADFLVDHDALTGTLNHSHFNAALKPAVAPILVLADS